MTYCQFLTDLARREKFAYEKLQSRRDSSIQNTLDTLSSQWMRAKPYFVKTVAEKLRPIVADKEVCRNALEQIEKNSLKIIDELDDKAKKYERDYNEASNSIARLKVCNDALSNLKDHPSIVMQSKDGWEIRKKMLSKLIDDSKTAVDGLRQKINEKSDRPEEQVSDINSFLQSEGATLTPEKKKEVEELSKLYVEQYSKVSNLWGLVSVSFQRFVADQTKYHGCKEDFDAYRHEVYDIQRRQVGVASYKTRESEIEQKLEEAKKNAEKWKSKYFIAWQDRCRPDREKERFKESAEALCELHKSMLHEESVQWINGWSCEIERAKDSCVKGSCDEEFKKVKGLLQLEVPHFFEVYRTLGSPCAFRASF